MAENIIKCSEEDLFECLKSLNVPCRSSELKTPTRDFMLRVFECFLRDLQIEITNPILKTFDAIKHFENPDIFQDAQSLMLLLIGINFITNPAGLLINIKDITEPKPKRTKRILNNLIVLWNNALKKLANFDSIEQTFQKERKQADELINENETLEGKYNEGLSILNSMQPSKEELISCAASKFEKIRELDTQKEKISAEYNALKKKENELQSQVTAAEIGLVSTKEKITELDQLILTSPERLSTDLQKLKEYIKNEEIRIREKEMELKEKKKKHDGLINTHEDNLKNLEILHGLLSGLQNWRNVVESILVDNQKYQEEEEQVRRTMSELEMKDKFKTIHADKTAKVLLNTQKQKESIKETLDMLQKNVMEVKKNLKFIKVKESQISQKINEEADSVIEVVKKCKQAETLTENVYTEYATRMEAICTSFQSDCEELKSQAKHAFKL